MIENFKYNDIVLYAKGWLEHKGNDTCEDLAYLLGQMYGWSSTPDDEISMMMLRVFDCLIEEMQGKHWSGQWATRSFPFRARDKAWDVYLRLHERTCYHSPCPRRAARYAKGRDKTQ